MKREENNTEKVDFVIDPEELRKALEIVDKQPWMDASLPYGQREYLFRKFFKSSKVAMKGSKRGVMLP